MPKLADFLTALPADSRDAVRNVLFLLRDRAASDADAAAALDALGRSLERARQRKVSDRQTDHGRRRLVGARVHREAYWRYYLAARKQGISLYQWVSDALQAAADKQGVVLDTEELADLIVEQGVKRIPKREYILETIFRSVEQAHEAGYTVPTRMSDETMIVLAKYGADRAMFAGVYRGQPVTSVAKR